MALNLFSFSSGALSSAVSDDQAIQMITESIGLGLDKYKQEKTIQMLENPLDYLKDKNKAYDDLAEGVKGGGGYYAKALTEVNAKLPTAYQGTPWAKQVAIQRAALKAQLDKQLIDLQYPVERKAEKAMKKKNKRFLAGNVDELTSVLED